MGPHRLFQESAPSGFSLAMVGTVLAGEYGSFYGAMAAMALQSGQQPWCSPSAWKPVVFDGFSPHRRGMLLVSIHQPVLSGPG